MFRLNHVEENQAYRADLLRRAEQHRIVREALAGRRGRVAFYGPILVGVGKTLIAWGGALQTRYASASERNPHYTSARRSRLQPNG
jgi:hypothetical protein